MHDFASHTHAKYLTNYTYTLMFHWPLRSMVKSLLFTSDERVNQSKIAACMYIDMYRIWQYISCNVGAAHWLCMLKNINYLEHNIMGQTTSDIRTALSFLIQLMKCTLHHFVLLIIVKGIVIVCGKYCK
jgi:hypothetical protein